MPYKNAARYLIVPWTISCTKLPRDLATYQWDDRSQVVPGIRDGAIYKNLSIDDHRDGPQIVLETPWVETDSSSLCNAPFSTGRSRQT